MSSLFSRSGKKAASRGGSSKPAKFDFKTLKRDKTGGSGGGGGGGGNYARESAPTKAYVHKAKFQSGDREGEDTGNRLFVFNPRKGLNDKAIAAVKALAHGKDDVSGFKKDLKGFTIKVHAPKQATAMHEALRKLDKDTSVSLDGIRGWEEPEVTVITLANVDLPATEKAESQTGVTAIMLDGFTYPLYKILRNELGYDFVRGVHNREGINRWMRVVVDGEAAADLEKEISAAFIERGWNVKTAAADAAEWDEDESDDGEE